MVERKKLPELPEEIIHKEILTRLPIKSVVRFGSVAKSWLSLFSNPQFKNEHFINTTTQNPNDYDCLVAEKDEKITIINYHEETTVLPYNYVFDDYLLIGSIHGLVCLYNEFSKIVLWNPAIHRYKEVILSLCNSNLKRIGFGFDAHSNDYKVVVCYLNDGLRYASVYSNNSDSWINLVIPVDIFPKYVRRSVAPATTVKGCPYWKFSEYSFGNTYKSVFVVKFDVGCNEFKLLPPFHSPVANRALIFDGRRKRFKLVNMNDSLAIMVYEEKRMFYNDVYIHSFDEEKGTWIESVNYDMGSLDHIVKYRRLTQGFKDDGKIVFHRRGKFYYYDENTDSVKNIISTRCSNPKVHCFRYTPSLVFLQGMKSVPNIQTRTYGY